MVWLQKLTAKRPTGAKKGGAQREQKALSLGETISQAGSLPPFVVDDCSSSQFATVSRRKQG
jgi:hypothetical protein